MTILYILCAILAIGVIIFIHEAGHFLAAKKVGVRVERFAVGFDPPFRGKNLRLFAYKHGETEYVIGAIPFGGYVKMAGETLLDDNVDPAERKPDELVAKSAGARALVFAAGAIMNIISAYFFFIIAFTLGVPFPAPKLGMIEPGSPAWRSGLEPADRVVAVNGSPVVDWLGFQVAVALGNRTEPIEIAVERDNGASPPSQLRYEVRPEWRPSQGFYSIGTHPALSPVLGAPQPDSPAALAGIRAGDRLVGVDIGSLRMTGLPLLALFRTIRNGRVTLSDHPMDLLIERDGTEISIRVPDTPLDSPPEKSQGQIGVLVENNVVRELRPSSAASKAGLLRPGDSVRSVGGVAVGTMTRTWARIARSILDGEDTVTLEVTGIDGANRSVSIPAQELFDWMTGGEIMWGRHAGTVGSLTAGSSLAAAGILEHDRVAEVQGDACYDLEDTKTLLGQAQGAKIAVGLLRGESRVDVELTRASADLLAQALAEGFPPVDVLEGGPAATAGLRPGDTLVALGEQRLASWSELLQAVGELSPGDKTILQWRTPEGEEKEGQLTISPASSLLSLSAKVETNVIQGSVLEAVELGARSTVKVGLYVFMTLRSLIRSDVSAKNLSGPVGITHALTKVSEERSFSYLLYFMAMISVNLGLFNLLPFPILDGGHLLFLAIEKVKGSPVDIRYQEWATNIALLLILSLAVFVTFNDVLRLIG